MGSYEEHQEILNDVASSVELYFDDVETEVEYYRDNGQTAGEFDIKIIDEEDNMMYYLEIKSSYKQDSKGRKQLKRAEEYHRDLGYNFYGEIVHEDDIEEVIRFMAKQSL